MNKEEILSLNGYLEDLYQAMKSGDIIFKANHSFELYNLIHKLLEENQKYKEVINKAIDYIEENKQHEYRNGNLDEYYLELNEKEMTELLDILKKVEHEKGNN